MLTLTPHCGRTRACVDPNYGPTQPVEIDANSPSFPAIVKKENIGRCCIHDIVHRYSTKYCFNHNIHYWINSIFLLSRDESQLMNFGLPQFAARASQGVDYWLAEGLIFVESKWRRSGGQRCVSDQRYNFSRPPPIESGKSAPGWCALCLFGGSYTCLCDILPAEPFKQHWHLLAYKSKLVTDK